MNPKNLKEAGRHPRSDARFTPWDFAEIFENLPEDCPLVGGQAVACWAERYGIKIKDGEKEPGITSRDIDFWGSRSDLIALAKHFHHKPILPNAYEMTVWTGAFEHTIRGQKTLVEFLHTIPGLDTNNPDHACVEQEQPRIRKNIFILNPISLVLAKLHALRHFDQKDRNDQQHLMVSIEASNRFISELLEDRENRDALWNCQRLIDCHHLKATRRLEEDNRFNVLDGIPIAEIRRQSINSEQPAENRRKLANFCAVQWPRIVGSPN